jgi:hypothetical protein
MRTKTMILGAAVFAAGALSSMAQSSVYSLNVVGYVTVPLANGYNLVANQLDVDGIDNVATVFPNVPDSTTLIQWDPVGQGFTQPVQFYAGSGWYDGSFNPAANIVSPTNGCFFLYNASGSPTTVTMVGNVVQGTNNLPIGGAYSFQSIVAPIAQDLDTNGFPAQDSMTLITWDPVGQGYTQPIQYYAGSGWFDGSFNQQYPTPPVGSGFVIYNPSTPVTWACSFNVQ